ncbi:MAG: choice-of-anchor tandem repeat NxxGxxAF-containing protein, partial [Planctomycetota bacterium]
AFLSLNDAGQAAFLGDLTGTAGGGADDTGLFRGAGGAITQIARAGQAAPDGNGTFSNFFNFNPALNDSGQAAFLGVLTGTSGGGTDNSGLFRSSGGALTQITREGQAAPDGNGTFSGFGVPSGGFGPPALNDAGQVAFSGFLTGTAGGGADNSGIFRGAGGTLTRIAREGQAAPDGNGILASFENPALNNAGQAAFLGNLTGTSGGFSDDRGIFRGAGGALTQIAREGQAAPDGNGTLSSFNADIVLNDAGQAAFFGDLIGTAGGVTDNTGLFRGSGGALTRIAREGQAAPDGNGTFGAFVGAAPALNDAGQAAFLAILTGNSGGSLDDRGVYTSDGIDLLKVIRKGDALAGGTVSGIS